MEAMRNVKFYAKLNVPQLEGVYGPVAPLWPLDARAGKINAKIYLGIAGGCALFTEHYPCGEREQ